MSYPPQQNGFSNGYSHYNPPRPNGYSGFAWSEQFAMYDPELRNYRNPNIYYPRDPRDHRVTPVQRTPGPLLPHPMQVPQIIQQQQQPASRPLQQIQPPKAHTHSASSTATSSNQRNTNSKPINSTTTTQSKQSNDSSSNVPKLRHISNMSKNERKKHRKEYQTKYASLSFDELTKIKDDITNQLKYMQDEKKRKEKELSDLSSSLSVSQIYVSDICDAIAAATAPNGRGNQRRVASIEAEQKIREATDRYRQLNEQVGSLRALIDKRNRDQLQRQQQQQQQQQQKNNQKDNINRNKRFRFDSPPRSNHSSESNGSSSSTAKSIQTEADKALAQAQLSNILQRVASQAFEQHCVQQQQQPQTKDVSPTNTVQSTAVTSSNSTLPPYPSDGGETSYKFVNFLLKFSVVNVIVKAKIYILKPTTKATVNFRLTQQQLQLLRNYKNDKNNANNNHRLILRMSRPRAEQREYYDFVPSKVKVKVDGKTPLYPGEKKYNTNNPNQPKPKKPEYIEAPLDISEESADKLDVNITFEVESGNQEVNVIIGVYFIRLLTLSESINAFNQYRQLRSVKFGLDCVDKLLKDPDSGFVDESLPGSLACPISKQRMRTPCVGVSCQHFNCFDLVTFLQLHSKTYLWKCPICDQVINSGHVVLDGLFQDLLNKTKDNCLSVTFYGNGNWAPTELVEKVVDVDTSTEVCLLSDDDDDD